MRYVNLGKYTIHGSSRIGVCSTENRQIDIISRETLGIARSQKLLPFDSSWNKLPKIWVDKPVRWTQSLKWWNMWKLSTKLGNHYRSFQTGVGTKVPSTKKSSLLEISRNWWKLHQIIHYLCLTNIHWMIQTFLTLRKMFNTRSVQATLAVSALKDETNYFMWNSIFIRLLMSTGTSNQKNRMSSLKLLEPAMFFSHVFSSFMCTDLKSSNWNITLRMWMDRTSGSVFKCSSYPLHLGANLHPTQRPWCRVAGASFVEPLEFHQVVGVVVGKCWQCSSLVAGANGRFLFRKNVCQVIQCNLFIPYLEVT